MKKRFLVLIVSVIFCVVFVSWPHKNSPRPVTEHDAASLVSHENWQKFSQENWTFSVPEGSWEEINNSVEEIKVAIKDSNKDCLLLFSKEDTIDSLGVYVAGTIQVFVDNGAKIYSVFQISVNNNKFILVQMTRKHEVIWFWLTVKDGAGYNFACVNEYNPDAGLDANRDFCESIANTIQIN